MKTTFNFNTLCEIAKYHHSTQMGRTLSESLNILPGDRDGDFITFDVTEEENIILNIFALSFEERAWVYTVIEILYDEGYSVRQKNWSQLQAALLETSSRGPGGLEIANGVINILYTPPGESFGYPTLWIPNHPVQPFDLERLDMLMLPLINAAQDALS